MPENEGHYVSIRELIDALKGGSGNYEQIVGASLDELYSSDQYGIASVNPTGADTSLPYEPVAWRLLVAGELMPISVVVTMPQFAKRSRQILDRLLIETAKLPVRSGEFRELEPDALASLRKAGLKTVAAMQVSDGIPDKRRMIAVCYPKPFRDIFPIEEMFAYFGMESRQGSDLKSDMALGMAMHFLKSAPFGRGNVRIPLGS